MTKFNDSHFEGLGDLYKSGKTIKQCAKHYGCSVETIFNRLKKYNVQTRGYIKYELLGLKKMYESGKSIRKCAEHYGCADSTIYSRLLLHGVKFRSIGKLDANVEEIRAMYNSGKTLKQCAEFYSCSEPVIFDRIRKLPKRKDRYADLPEKYKEFGSMQKCADHFNCSIFLIHKKLIGLGIETY